MRQLGDTVSSQSISFGGKFINQSVLSRLTGISQSYISRMLSGERSPDLQRAVSLASAMDMSIEEFLDAIEKRKKAIADNKALVESQYYRRVAAEDLEDLATLKKTGIVSPRIPGLRVKNKQVGYCNKAMPSA